MQPSSNSPVHFLQHDNTTQYVDKRETNSRNERGLNALTIMSYKSVVNAAAPAASITWLVTEPGAVWSHQSNVIVDRPPNGLCCANLLISANWRRVLCQLAARTASILEKHPRRNWGLVVKSPVLWTVDLMFCACSFFIFSQLTFSDACKPIFSKLFHMTWLYSKKKRCYADFLKVPPNKNEGRKTPNFAQSRV